MDHQGLRTQNVAGKPISEVEHIKGDLEYSDTSMIMFRWKRVACESNTH